ncbi:MAG: hypothetical protein ACTH2S_09915, partial [Arthrobacter rhombi]
MTNPSLDTQRQSTDRSRWGLRDVGLISVFVARAATLNLIPAIPVGPQGVPSTLQPLALCLEALCLGGPRGSVSVLPYAVAGDAVPGPPGLPLRRVGASTSNSRHWQAGSCCLVSPRSWAASPTFALLPVPGAWAGIPS